MDRITLGRKNVGKELGGGSAVWCDCPSDANYPFRTGFWCKGKPLVNGQNCCERNVMKMCYTGKKSQGNKFRISQTLQSRTRIPKRYKNISRINRNMYNL